MKTLTVYLILLCCSSLPIFGQSVKAEFSMTQNSYSMSDLKAYQNHVRIYQNSYMKIVDNFPDYFGYSVTVMKSIRPGLYAGFVYGRLSTGGKMAYSDYSGSAAEYLNLTSNAFGLAVSYDVFKISWFKLQLSLHAVKKWSKLSWKRTFRVWDEVEEEKYHWNSEGWGLEPRAGIMVRVINHLDVGLLAGYHADSNTAFTRHSSTLQIAMFQYYRRYIKPQWNGIRLGAMVSVGF